MQGHVRRDSLFSYFHDGGFDNVLEFLLGLVPHHEPFAARVRWHVRLAELDRFGLASLPMFKGHKLFGHAVDSSTPHLLAVANTYDESSSAEQSICHERQNRFVNHAYPS